MRKKTGMEVSPSTWLVGETEAPGHDELRRPWRSLQGIGSACQPQNQAKPGPCWWAESAFPSFISINIYWYSRCDGFYGRPWGCRNGRDIISTLETRLVGREKRRPVYLRNCGFSDVVGAWERCVSRNGQELRSGADSSSVKKMLVLQAQGPEFHPQNPSKKCQKKAGNWKGGSAIRVFWGGLGLIPSAHTMAHSRL